MQDIRYFILLTLLGFATPSLSDSTPLHHLRNGVKQASGKFQWTGRRITAASFRNFIRMVRSCDLGNFLQKEALTSPRSTETGRISMNQ